MSKKMSKKNNDMSLYIEKLEAQLAVYEKGIEAFSEAIKEHKKFDLESKDGEKQKGSGPRLQ